MILKNDRWDFIESHVDETMSAYDAAKVGAMLMAVELLKGFSSCPVAGPNDDEDPTDVRMPFHISDGVFLDLSLSAILENSLDEYHGGLVKALRLLANNLEKKAKAEEASPGSDGR